MNLQELGGSVGGLLLLSVLLRYYLDRRDKNKRMGAVVEQIEINKEINRLIEKVRTEETNVNEKREAYEKIRDRVIDISERTKPRK